MSQDTGELEAKLRTLMDIAAGEPTRQVTVDAVRRGVVRRRRAASAAAAAALLLIGGVGVAVAAQRDGFGNRPAAPATGGHSRTVTAPGGGVPPYYVARTIIPNNGRTANREETTVRASASGALRARVRCPVSAPYVPTWPVAPAENQNFFLVCQRATGPASYDKVLESSIIQFHLTGAGLVTDELPVRGGLLGGLLVRSIAATPDGSELAVIVYPGTHPPDLHRTPPDVIVINTRTGARAIWHGAAPVSGQTVYWPEDISLTADGQRLAFLTEPQCFQTGCTTLGGQQVRVITHPASGGGQLNSAALLVELDPVLRSSHAGVMDAVISPDGSKLTLAVMGPMAGQPGPNSVSVVQIPATGQRWQRVLYQLPQGDAFSFFSADPSGRHFLLGTGTPAGLLAGRIDNGKLIPLRPDPVSVQAMVW